MKNRFRILLILAVIAGNVLIDQATKQIARTHLRGKGRIEVVGDLFVMRYTENSGAFLGLGSGLKQPWRTIVFSLFPTIIMTALIIYIFRSRAMQRWELIWYACIIGGGIGNIIDRLLFSGMVTDFLNFGIGTVRTGILNLADISITAGVTGILVLSVKQHLEEKKQQSSGSITPEAEATRKSEEN